MTTRASNHARAPKSAVLVESMRSTFGDVVVLYVNENGVKLGEPSPEGGQVTILAPKKRSA